MITTKRGAMTRVLSRAGGVTTVTLAVALAATAFLSPSSRLPSGLMRPERRRPCPRTHSATYADRSMFRAQPAGWRYAYPHNPNEPNAKSTPSESTENREPICSCGDLRAASSCVYASRSSRAAPFFHLPMIRLLILSLGSLCQPMIVGHRVVPQFVVSEIQSNFPYGRFRRVRSMHHVVLQTQSEVASDRTYVGL